MVESTEVPLITQKRALHVSIGVIIIHISTQRTGESMDLVIIITAETQEDDDLGHGASQPKPIIDGNIVTSKCAEDENGMPKRGIDVHVCITCELRSIAVKCWAGCSTPWIVKRAEFEMRQLVNMNMAAITAIQHTLQNDKNQQCQSSRFTTATKSMIRAITTTAATIWFYCPLARNQYQHDVIVERTVKRQMDIDGMKMFWDMYEINMLYVMLFIISNYTRKTFPWMNEWKISYNQSSHLGTLLHWSGLPQRLKSPHIFSFFAITSS